MPPWEKGFPTIRKGKRPNPGESRRPSRAAALCVALAHLVACAREEPSAETKLKETELVVFAAASLRDAFTSIGAGFEECHPGARVAFSFAGTQQLRLQVEHGASVDVFASADPAQIAELVRTGRALGPVVFARNEPVVVVAQESAAKIQSFSDLPTAERIVIGAPEVPIGGYSLQILDRASSLFGSDFRSRVERKVVSRELNVRQVYSKVSLGEAEAGIVYRSDAQSGSDRVSSVPIPPSINVVAEYPIAIVKGAKHPNLAKAWVDLVCSVVGQRALAKAGFLGASGSIAGP